MGRKTLSTEEIAARADARLMEKSMRAGANGSAGGFSDSDEEESDGGGYKSPPRKLVSLSKTGDDVEAALAALTNDSNRVPKPPVLTPRTREALRRQGMDVSDLLPRRWQEYADPQAPPPRAVQHKIQKRADSERRENVELLMEERRKLIEEEDGPQEMSAADIKIERGATTADTSAAAEKEAAGVQAFRDRLKAEMNETLAYEVAQAKKFVEQEKARKIATANAQRLADERSERDRMAAEEKRRRLIEVERRKKARLAAERKKAVEEFERAERAKALREARMLRLKKEQSEEQYQMKQNLRAKKGKEASKIAKNDNKSRAQYRNRIIKMHAMQAVPPPVGHLHPWETTPQHMAAVMFKDQQEREADTARKEWAAKAKAKDIAIAKLLGAKSKEMEEHGKEAAAEVARKKALVDEARAEAWARAQEIAAQKIQNVHDRDAHHEELMQEKARRTAASRSMNAATRNMNLAMKRSKVRQKSEQDIYSRERAKMKNIMEDEVAAEERYQRSLVGDQCRQHREKAGLMKTKLNKSLSDFRMGSKSKEDLFADLNGL